MKLQTIAAAATAACMLALPALQATAGELPVSDMKIDLVHPDPWPLSHLVSKGDLTIVTTGKTAGETMVNAKGQLEGARIDLWTKMAHDLGLKPVFVRSDWAGVIPGIAANRFDLGCEGASWNNQRLASKDFFLSRPIKVQIDVAVVRKGSKIESFDDMKGKKLGGVKGEIELQELADKVGVNANTVLGLPGVTEARLALTNHQIDVYGTNISAATSLLNSDGGDQFRMIKAPTYVGVSGFCVNAREPDLLTAVNFMMAKYRADGTIKALNKKWGLPDTSDLLTKIGY